AESGAFHWAFIALGSALLLAIIVLSSILGVQLITNLRWSQRQSNFIASVSHELKSPLTSIKLFAQTLRRADLAAGDRGRFAGKILHDVDRLSRIVANSLRAAEVDNREELRVALEPVDLRAYLEDYVQDARPLYRDKLDLTLDGDGDARVEIDRVMFRQVLDNLVDNAIRYRQGDRAEVELRLSPADGVTELQVRDRGIGIPSDRLGHIFDRFYRIEEGGPRTGRKGMGIGLNVVRSIMRSHHGSVEASSDGPGRGAVIRLRLPAAAAKGTG
ncbi:MAG: sensor histidine kinase, partial [Planctomycetota bacterium]